MKRAYVTMTTADFVAAAPLGLLGELTEGHHHALENEQRDAWTYEIEHLKEVVQDLHGTVLMEFAIPRMGRRADAILLISGLVFVLEYKVGASEYEAGALRQCLDYALDLKYFHSGSHNRRIVPVLVATRAPEQAIEPIWLHDGIARPACASAGTLRVVLERYLKDRPAEAPLDPLQWIESAYRPTPTIVEAAKALYAGHQVEEITRSEAGAENLSRTGAAIGRLIESAKAKKQKIICFVTGVPGSGKTLAGLNIATQRMRSHDDEHAVFLSGNGPLVDVLREALARDELGRAIDPTLTKEVALKHAKTFVQNIHHFRDDALVSSKAPAEHVVVFDEAQRAWDKSQTSKFMQQKRSRPDFEQSEPEFLLSVMDRHSDWCCVVCLVGGGQEINTGEAGLVEWLGALQRSFKSWRVVCADNLVSLGLVAAEDGRAILSTLKPEFDSALHLQVSVRSFRSERTAAFVGELINGNKLQASALLPDGVQYPIVLCRKLETAKAWLRSKARGSERIGLVASSNALRLKPLGLHMKAKIDPVNWFLNDQGDVRSSFALEDAASEFDVQGLELDWVGVCWDANLRMTPTGWSLHEFRGTTWQDVSAEARRRYLLNAYRVLLTRARQGMVIVVPEGDHQDPTRDPLFLQRTFGFLRDVGIPLLSE